MRVLAALLIAAALLARPAGAAEVSIWPRETQDCDDLIFNGYIVPSDFDALVAANARARPCARRMLVLSSLGGDVATAMRIGRFLREHNFLVWVPSSRPCASACVILAVGGTSRIFVAPRVGIHRPRYDGARYGRLAPDEAARLYDRMSAELREYLADMTLADDLFRAMLAVRGDRIRWLTEAEAERLGIGGSAPSMDEWRRAREAGGR